ERLRAASLWPGPGCSAWPPRPSVPRTSRPRPSGTPPGGSGARWRGMAPTRGGALISRPRWAGPPSRPPPPRPGARVPNTPHRPGARPPFCRWLHPPVETAVRVDLSSGAGWRRAAELIDEADVVIEASRPRAMEQLGLGPEDRPDRPGRVWLSITGYGRQAPGRDWIAFGDDAAVAGGLIAWDARDEPVFCGDALADPITGLAGALAVLRSREAGGGELIDLAMSRAAARAAGAPARLAPTSAGSPRRPAPP